MTYTTDPRTFAKCKLEEIECKRADLNAAIDKECEKYLMAIDVLDELDNDVQRSEVEKRERGLDEKAGSL